MLAEALAGDGAVAAAPVMGWPRLQARWVDRIKRAALRQLHASAAGERLLLRMYLAGEEASEAALRGELGGACPPWLSRQTRAHLAEENGHCRAFAAALLARGEGGTRPEPMRPDWLSRRKLAQWQQLARRHAARFANGPLVPAMAICLCAEQMAARVLERHCQVIGQDHPLHPLFSAVLADERRHVRLCARAVERLVGSDEQTSLAALFMQARCIERSFAIGGSLAMLAAGLLLRLRRAPARH